MPETVDRTTSVFRGHAVALIVGLILSLVQIRGFDAVAQTVPPTGDTKANIASEIQVRTVGNDLISADYQTILADVGSGNSRLTVVNMWATWCGPCIEEFPDFVKLARQYDSSMVRVLFVSVDFEEQLPEVKEFLAGQQWERMSYFKNQKDDEFVNGFAESWTGAVPATFVFDSDGGLLWFVEGKTTFSAVKSVIESNVE